MRPRVIAWLVSGASASALLLNVSAVWACVVDLVGAHSLQSERYMLAYRTEPAKLAVAAHFSVELAVCASAGAPAPESVRVDAYMPEHRHGMNYRAVVKAQGDGRFRAEGLLFHMPGRWEYVFEVRAAGRTDRLTHSVVLD